MSRRPDIPEVNQGDAVTASRNKSSDIAESANAQQQVTQAYNRVFGRDPSAQEIRNFSDANGKLYPQWRTGGAIVDRLRQDQKPSQASEDVSHGREQFQNMLGEVTNIDSFNQKLDSIASNLPELESASELRTLMDDIRSGELRLSDMDPAVRQTFGDQLRADQELNTRLGQEQSLGALSQRGLLGTGGGFSGPAAQVFGDIAANFSNITTRALADWDLRDFAEKRNFEANILNQIPGLQQALLSSEAGLLQNASGNYFANQRHGLSAMGSELNSLRGQDQFGQSLLFSRDSLAAQLQEAQLNRELQEKLGGQASRDSAISSAFQAGGTIIGAAYGQPLVGNQVGQQAGDAVTRNIAPTNTVGQFPSFNNAPSSGDFTNFNNRSFSSPFEFAPLTNSYSLKRPQVR